MTKIEFKKGDPFFEPVLSFFLSYLGYHLLFVDSRPSLWSGRFRGNIVPQVKFDNEIPRVLRNREDISNIDFELDFSDPGEIVGDEIIQSTSFTTFWIQQMVGHAYEIAESTMENKFGSPMDRPKELQFFRHIRNGCFHKNQFNIRPGSISTSIATEWRGKSITDQENGQQVIMGFLGMGDPIVLLHDIQTMLN